MGYIKDVLGADKLAGTSSDARKVADVFSLFRNKEGKEMGANSDLPRKTAPEPCPACKSDKVAISSAYLPPTYTLCSLTESRMMGEALVAARVSR